VVLLGRALREQTAEVTEALSRARHATSAATRDDRVRARLAAMRPEHRRAPYSERAAAQQARLILRIPMMVAVPPESRSIADLWSALL
jgi:5-methyltetrahydropteroyltriglutamate--homocysteine methyltransferase